MLQVLSFTNMTREQNLSQKYKDLKNQLMQIGLAIPGTIHALYALCGSPECECVKNKSKRHGPYYRWHHFAEKHKVTLGINETDLQQFEMWIKNREALEYILKQLLELGAAHAEKYIVANKRLAEKLKKVSSSKRGK